VTVLAAGLPVCGYAVAQLADRRFGRRDPPRRDLLCSRVEPQQELLLGFQVRQLRVSCGMGVDRSRCPKTAGCAFEL